MPLIGIPHRVFGPTYKGHGGPHPCLDSGRIGGVGERVKGDVEFGEKIKHVTYQCPFGTIV